MTEIQNRIQKIIDENQIVVFMKGTPQSPQCGFSAQTIQCLSQTGAQFGYVNVLADPEIRQGIKEFTQWPTIPQVFIRGEFVGGCDIITEMFERGELQSKINS